MVNEKLKTDHRDNNKATIQHVQGFKNVSAKVYLGAGFALKVNVYF
jgi:hypothetical protein